MKPTPSELATINFYEWEYLGRGYFHFENVVDIEPPYRPFYHGQYAEFIDDGKFSIIKSITNIFKPKDIKAEINDYDLVPNLYFSKSKTTGFSISFEKGKEIQPAISLEFINMLSYSEDVISFEIIANSEQITFQIICSINDEMRIKSHLKAYFPNIQITDINIYDLGFNDGSDIAIADFGFFNEFMRPISTAQSFNIDPLTSIIATMDNLEYRETLLLQVIFKGVSAPWSNDIMYSVSDGMGGSFFSDSPEMINCAKEKISSPLFSVIMRMAGQGINKERSKILTQELSRSISNVSKSQFNQLIPLSNKDYEYENHLNNLFERRSNRLGMIMNSNELVNFVHYPNKSIVSKKLIKDIGKTKVLPKECINQKFNIGINTFNGNENIVSLNDTQRLKHIHIIGVTGVGKSTLLANMIIEDMSKGNGCLLLDPHGDIVDDILLRIPEKRKDDVILIDPSDTEYSVGFNLLQANSEIEKIVLSSDLVSSFKRYATAWGDNMTAVLSNAINTFLESEKGGTIIELKRFLIETSFRKTFLLSVKDKSLNYYWEYEYPMVKKGIAPLLTRIDTFLRSKILRYMFAQKDGVDFKEAINSKRIILIKLSQGLIGEQNSYLLGSIFISKINQVAQNRQAISKENRHPYYIYIDEFHNFITPSISSILSGTRKYGIGLILANQELSQIEDTKILNSVISNPYTRICFRLGDFDSKKLETGFSYFEQNDLQNLNTGQAIIRVGSNNNDFNIQTYPLKEISNHSEEIKRNIIQIARSKYSKSIQEVQKIIDFLLPTFYKNKSEYVKEITRKEKPKTELKVETEKVESFQNNEIRYNPKEEQEKLKIKEQAQFEKEKDDYLERFEKQERIKKHRSLQNLVRTMAIQRGFKATLEEETKNGGRVDVGLTKDNLRIAIEISVSNTVEYEVKNIQKCIDDGYNFIFMISEDEKHLNKIKKLSLEKLEKKHGKNVFFFNPNSFINYLNKIEPQTKNTEKRILGYRVITEYEEDTSCLRISKQDEIAKMIIEALRE